MPLSSEVGEGPWAPVRLDLKDLWREVFDPCGITNRTHDLSFFLFLAVYHGCSEDRPASNEVRDVSP